MASGGGMVDFGQMLERLDQIPAVIEELRKLRSAFDAAPERQEYLDYEAAAGYLNLGVTTLQQHVCAKRVPYYKLGARVLFVRSELDEWMRAKRVCPLSKRLDGRG